MVPNNLALYPCNIGIITLYGDVMEKDSKFLKVRCGHKREDGKTCNNEQIVFNKTSTDVKCLVCGELLVKSTGGKAKIMTKVVKSVS